MTIYGESWTPVPGYVGLYQVSAIGRVWSERARRMLIPQDRKGYRKTTLCGRGKPWQVNVATLVLLAFTGPRPPGMLACHGPAGRMFGAVWNLYWATPGQNQGPDRLRDGTWQGLNGHGGRPKLLGPADVTRARELRAAGLSFAQIGQRFGVHKETARNAVRGLARYGEVT